MNQIYRQQLIDNYKDPQNFGKIENATHTHELKNLSCGDEIKIYLIVEDKKVKDIKFEGSGCAICIGSTSLLTEEIKDKPVSEILAMEFEDILKLIGVEVSPSRIKCAHLGLLTTQKALDLYQT